MSPRPELEVRMCALYPDHMNIYADRGNIVFVQRRCEWRGIGFRLSGSGFGDDLDPAGHDLLYMGGGQDSDQVRVAGDLVETKAGALSEAVGSGTPMLAVCGGYQLLGHSYQLADETLPGTGLADLRTVREPGER
ncbi:MAG: glutamine amidotransferase, partial [Solirubrobacterales bacterium]